VLRALEAVKHALVARPDQSDPAVRTIRQGLGYCWSVAIAALPSDGGAAFERWLDSSDLDVRWILRENLRKQRLKRMDCQLGRAITGALRRPRGPNPREQRPEPDCAWS
jgi:hypothetical protein